jgi:hypothetical protein
MAKNIPKLLQASLVQDINDNEERIRINEYLLMTMHNARGQLLERRAGLLAMQRLCRPNCQPKPPSTPPDLSKRSFHPIPNRIRPAIQPPTA